MSHNFQRGIDHGNNTDDPNTYFVDGGCYNNPGGDDNNNGSSALPWKTIDFAINNTAAGDIIVFADGTYNLGVLIQDRVLIGDTKRKVIINDPLGTQAAIDSSANVFAHYIVFKGFDSLGAPGSFGETLTGCTVLDVGTVSPFGQAKYYETRFINATISQVGGNNDFFNCALFNCIIPKNGGNNLRFYRTWFDSTTKTAVGTGTPTIGINDISYVFDKAFFEDGDNSGILYDGSEIEELTSPALIISSSYFDFAVQESSSLITNDANGNVGGFYKGMSYSPDVPGFVAIVNANPDVEIVNSEIVPVASVSIGQTVYVEGFSFIASTRSRLTFWFPVGINDFCNYVFEVRTADVGEDINFAAWKPYKQGEKMTKNMPSGVTTGEPNYDFADPNNVDYKTAEGRIAITKIA